MRGLFRNKLAMVGLVIILLMSGCYIAIPSGSWHYKVTVEIDTPEGIKTGSAVRSVSIFEIIHTAEIGATITPRGEAVVVDLGKRGLVFGLTGFDDYRVVLKAFPDPSHTLRQTLNYYSHLKNVKAEISPQYYPMFVAFKNLSDPMSVVNLYEASDCMRKDRDGTCILTGFHVTGDHFEEIFGAGVRLKSVSVQMTDEPVTRGIEKILPWLITIKGKYIDGTSASMGVPLGLDTGNFQNGV